MMVTSCQHRTLRSDTTSDENKNKNKNKNGVDRKQEATTIDEIDGYSYSYSYSYGIEEKVRGDDYPPVDAKREMMDDDDDDDDGEVSGSDSPFRSVILPKQRRRRNRDGWNNWLRPSALSSSSSSSSSSLSSLSSSSGLVLVLLGMAMVLLETRCVCVEGFVFVPNARTSSKEGIHRCSRYSERSRFPSATGGIGIPQNNWNFGRGKSSGTISVRVPTARFSSSSSLEEQETETANDVSLEWIEFYAPDDDNDDDAISGEAPVLFLHGLLGSKRNFATCANMLARRIDKKRRIIGVDLRNHGDTQPWSDNMSYPSMAQDVVQFLKSQNIEEVILVGHSMGGKVAQALALLHPEYVAGLVVLDIAPVTYTREADPHWRAVEDILRSVHEVIEDAEATGAETNKREIDRSLRKSIPDPALRAFVLTNYDSRNNQWKVPIATMVREIEQIAGFDLTATATTTTTTTTTTTLVASETSSTSVIYEGDVFIINGGQSRFVRHAYMDQIASYFPNHMLTTIRGSGHWVHAEAPDDLVALLKRYLDR